MHNALIVIAIFAIPILFLNTIVWVLKNLP